MKRSAPSGTQRNKDCKECTAHVSITGVSDRPLQATGTANHSVLNLNPKLQFPFSFPLPQYNHNITPML